MAKISPMCPGSNNQNLTAIQKGLYEYMCNSYATSSPFALCHRQCGGVIGPLQFRAVLYIVELKRNITIAVPQNYTTKSYITTSGCLFGM